MIPATYDKVAARPLFAAMAMQALVGDPNGNDHRRRRHVVHADGRELTPGECLPLDVRIAYDETTAEAVARLAVAHADALLVELERTAQKNG